MKILHIAWALASIGLSFGINDWTKPQIDYPLSIGQRTMSTGNLTLKVGNSQHEMQLIDVHVVASDVEQLFGHTILAREVMVRSPQQDDATPPDLELHFDFGRVQPGIPATARDAEPLVGRAIPIVLRPFGRPGRSAVHLPGAAATADVVEGTLTIEEAIEFDTQDAAASWRIRGEVELVLQDAEGARPARGRLRARLVWN